MTYGHLNTHFTLLEEVLSHTVHAFYIQEAKLFHITGRGFFP
jgi:hypothetical protein